MLPAPDASEPASKVPVTLLSHVISVPATRNAAGSIAQSVILLPTSGPRRRYQNTEVTRIEISAKSSRSQPAQPGMPYWARALPKPKLMSEPEVFDDEATAE